MGAGNGQTISTTQSIIAASSAIQGAASFSNAYSQSKAIQAEGEFRKQTADFNAKVAEIQADDSIRRGKKAVINVQKLTKKTIGDQRAALAAQGVELDSGSALLLQEDTAELGALDALTVKNNAYREAWGFRAQSLDFTSQGVFAQAAARNEARSTLATGGLRFVAGLTRSASALSARTARRVAGDEQRRKTS